MKISADRLKPNQKAIIVDIACEKEFKNRMIEMGLTNGTEIRLIKTSPFGDPIEYSVRGYKLVIRKADAKMITVMAGGG